MDEEEIYKAWLYAGFLPEEAAEFTWGSKGVEVNAEEVYNSMPARAARQSRRMFIKELLRAGWTFDEIFREIRAYYTRDTSRSPWEFIRAEYKPTRRKDFREYREAARRRSESQIKSLYRR